MPVKLSKKGIVILVIGVFLVVVPGIIATVWLLTRSQVGPDDTAAGECPGDPRFNTTEECVASCEWGCEGTQYEAECIAGCGNACDSLCRADDPDDCTCDGTAIGDTRCDGTTLDRCETNNNGAPGSCYWRDTGDACGDTPPVAGECHPADPSDAYGCSHVRCTYPAVTYCQSDGTCACISWQQQTTMPGGCSSDPAAGEDLSCPEGYVECSAGTQGCEVYESRRLTCDNCNNPTYINIYCKPIATPQDYTCWETGCTGTGCADGTSCVNDRCIDTDCPNDSDCNCDVEEEDSQVSGRVICQDPGESAIVIPGVSMSIIRNATGNTTTTTNSSGAYSVVLDDNEGFAVRISALPAGEVSPGVAYSDMVAPPSLNITARDSAHCNENTTGSYEMCNSSYSDNFTNFDFVYTGCTLEEQSYVCWDTGCTGTGCSDGSACVDNRCINPECPTESDCECPTESYTCWETGCTDVGCSDGTTCVADRCVDTECPTDSDCICDDVPEDWEIQKDGDPVCINGDVLYAEVDYSITVLNNSTETALLDRVEDEMDPRIDQSWIETGSIEPPYGTVVGNTIVWDLDASTGRFAAGESKVFSYTLIVPLEEFGQYLNTATGYPVSGGSFEVDNVEIVNCDQPPLPSTGLFDTALAKVGAGLLLIAISGAYFMSDGLDKHMFKYVTETGRIERSRKKFEKRVRE